MRATVALPVMPRLSHNHLLPHAVETLTVAYTAYSTHPYSAGGGYINMMMDEGTGNVKAAYRDNYARLAQIKARYDPSNLFQVNQNIKPTR